MGLMRQGIRTLRNALARREVSATELVETAFKEIGDDPLGAVLAMDREASLEQARAAQLRIDQGDASPLLGVPILHKDVFVTRAWPTTAGSRMLEGYRSPFDAEVVRRLDQAGMVCLGKANCDEFAMGSANQHSAYKPSRNPWSPTRVPGGSSGGSAAAVAAGWVVAATGTDTGGSVRQPASLCGITGLKPTYGRISRWGMVAYASSLDQAGPMAGSADDCAMMLNAMAGFDQKDATSLDRPEEDFTRYFGASLVPAQKHDEALPLKGLRVGRPKEFFAEGLSPGVAQPIDSALKTLEAMGAVVVDCSLPRTALSIPAYYVIAPAEASSNLARYDGIRYGHRAQQPRDLLDLYERSRSEGFGPEVKRRILVGAFVLSHGYFDAYYLQAQRVRRLIAMDFDSVFESCDFIVGPVSPTVAWPIEGRSQMDPLAEYLADIYTLGASLAGLPAMSVPCGFQIEDSLRLPVGLQIIAPRFEEARLLAMAHAFQQQTDWHKQQAPAQTEKRGVAI